MSQKWTRSKQWDDRNLPPAFAPWRFWTRRLGLPRALGALGVLAAVYTLGWTTLVQPAAADHGLDLNAWVLPAALAFYLVWPVKFLARAFSSIALAVVLLVAVAIYGTLASVTIGLLAKIPTYLIYGLTILAAVAVGAALPTFVGAWVLGKVGVGRAGRFAFTLLAFLGLSVSSVWLWNRYAWPALHYDPADGTGLMLFADFIEKYKAVTVRRLPGFEMTELEFYGWWPLRLILGLFVINMVVATVRRIEFTFPNLGVLTVHTGIVTIALGSIYYQRLKVEGDMLLIAGPVDERGNPAPGPPEGGFSDNTEVVLWINQRQRAEPNQPPPIPRFEQRLLRRLPRYNHYALNALGLQGFDEATGAWDDGRTLDIVPESLGRPSTFTGIDPDIQFRVVGFAHYAELAKRWVPALAPADPVQARPALVVDLISALPPRDPAAPPPTPADVAAVTPVEPKVAQTFEMLARVPARRIVHLGDGASIEYTRGMSPQRWSDLASPIPAWGGVGARHALIVEVPAAGTRQVYAVDAGQIIDVRGTGYTLEVKSLAPGAPFPLVTPGYEGADSSLAVVRITPPALPDGTRPAPFERWLYSRFPEIAQDLRDAPTPGAMAQRSAPDPAIRIAYVDASRVQVHLDEIVTATPAGESPGDVEFRAIVRLPGRDPAVITGIRLEEKIELAPLLWLQLSRRIPHTVEVEYPVPVAEIDQDRQLVGSFAKAAIAVNVSLRRANPGDSDAEPSAARPEFSRTLWVPFSKYLGVDSSLERTIEVPGAEPGAPPRELSLVFGRRRHALPGMALELIEFEMFPYEHSTIPRDFRSDVEVIDTWTGTMRRTRRHTSLNDPLLVRVPFRPSDQVPGFVNAVGWLLAQIAPESYKFSQSGWDSSGWEQTMARVEAGELDRPSARFTILGVGNNPGITIIAAGAVLMSVGIPWAFYVKPAIMQRRKRRLQAALQATRSQSPAVDLGVSAESSPATNPATN